MKNKEKKITIILVLLISFAALCTGRYMYNSKAYFDKFEMNFKNVATETEKQKEIFVAELKNFRAGQYTFEFDYEFSHDAVIKVNSYVAYDYRTDSMPVFLQETVPAGSGSYSGVMNLDDDYQAVTFTVITQGSVNMTDCKAVSDSVTFADRHINFAWFVAGVVAFTAVAIYIVLSKKDTEEIYASLLILYGLTAVAIASNAIYMFTDYSSFGCDIKFHMYRIKAIAESMLNGNIPNRINGISYFGYGYANPLLYPEIFLYLPASWINMGMSDLGAIKLFYILVGFLAVYLAYYSFEKMCGNRLISFSATVIYSLAYYKLINVYIRIALGETLFMAFLPVAVYGLYTFYYGEKRRWLLLAVSVSAIVQSQILGVVLACMILGILFGVFTLEQLINKQFNTDVIKDLAKAVVWTFFANLWFIVPFLNTYIRYGLIMFNRQEMISWFFNELLSAKNFLSASIMPGDKLVFSAVGLMVLVGLGGALVLCAASFVKAKKDRLLVLTMVAMTAVFGIICTDIINWQFWMSFRIMRVFLTTLQFSFRFEALFLMFLCLAIIFAWKGLEGRQAKVLSVALTAAVVLAVIPNMAEFIADAPYCREDCTYNSYGVDQPLEYLKPGADVMAEMLVEKKVTKSDNISINSYSKDGINIDFSITTDGNKGWMQFPLFYYDDYTAETENGQQLKVYSGDRALLYVEIPENMGNETVSIRFGNSMLYTVPLYISVVFLCRSGLVYIYSWYKQKKK